MVDVLLGDVSNNIAKEIESSIELLHALFQVVPTSNALDDGSPLDLPPPTTNTTTTTTTENDEDDRYFAAQIDRLYKLEAAWRTAHNGTNPRRPDGTTHDPAWKQRDKTHAAALELAHTLRAYPVETRERLARTYGRPATTDGGTAAAGGGGADVVAPVVEYLRELGAIGCGRLRTSVRDGGAEASEISGLAERCRALEKERAALGKVLREREIGLERDKVRFTAEHDALREELGVVRKAEEEERSRLDGTHDLDIQRRIDGHEKRVLSLRTELSDKENRLIVLRGDHGAERDGLIRRRAELEATKRRLAAEKRTLEQERIEADGSARRKTEAERLRRTGLERHFALLGINAGAADEEAGQIRAVIDMEDEADAILCGAATNFQRIFRGGKDRVLARKLAKKNRKGRKKQRKGKKKKKKTK